MKTRGYSIGARGIANLIDSPDIWEQLRSPTAAIEAKRCLQIGEESIYGLSLRSPSIAIDAPPDVGTSYELTIARFQGNHVAKVAKKQAA